jgi:hypothetical protein
MTTTVTSAASAALDDDGMEDGEKGQRENSEKVSGFMLIFVAFIPYPGVSSFLPSL